MKSQLVEMDPDGDGRVPLKSFYGSALEAEWRFGESEEYLRELGALDETSKWRGKQVMIANYIQASSNCIVSAGHYNLCCKSECEDHIGQLESAIGRPMATPQEILAVVRNMTWETPDLGITQEPKLKGSLTQQLETMASAQGGKVALHGRLFSQWMHYVFPHECPFPHKAGTVTTATPMEYGDDYIASHTQMHEHAASSFDVTSTEGMEEESLSQWSDDEEHFADYTGHLTTSREGKGGRWAVLFIILVGAAAAYAASKGDVALGGQSNAKDSMQSHWGMAEANKAHFV